MKFKLKPKPKHGDKRTVNKFAILPVRIGNELIWLEKYKQDQSFMFTDYMVTGGWYIDREYQ